MFLKSGRKPLTASAGIPHIGALSGVEITQTARGPRCAGPAEILRWSRLVGSPALCVDCAGTAPTFGLGDRHAYLEQRMNKLWPVPDYRIEQTTPDGPTHLRIAARSFQRARRCPDYDRVSRAVRVPFADGMIGEATGTLDLLADLT
jgi:hypothetical protein